MPQRMQGQLREVAPEDFAYYPLTKDEALIENLVFFLSHCVHHGRVTHYVTTGRCSVCTLLQVNKDFPTRFPTNITDAHKMHLDYYYISQPNRCCGHEGKMTIDGKCYECAQNKSPRKLAIKNGEQWYMPIIPCPHCKTRSLKRVANGECQGCKPETAKRTTPIHTINPDMIIDRKTALAAGLKVFRTGDPCRHGHYGWRYVSTGNCLKCMGRP